MSSLSAAVAGEASPTRRSALLALLGVVAAVAIVLWALGEPRFRDPAGDLEGSVIVPIGAAAALAALGVAATFGVARAGAWLALLLLGQSAVLALTVAGAPIRFQHLRDPSQWVHAASPIVAGIVLVQALVVALALATRLGAMWRWAREALGPWRLALLALVFVTTTALPALPVRAFATELAVGALLQAIALGTVVLAVAALPRDAGATLWRLLGAASDEARPYRLDRSAWIAAALVTVVAAVLAAASYGRHPHVPDEVVYLYHARYLAAGHLTLPAPPVPAAFDVYLMDVERARWFSTVPIGWPMMLAVGARLGAAWLVNPVLAGLNVLLAYLFLRELYTRRIARLAVIVLCVSPWYLLMAMNMMTHTFTTTAMLVAALSVARLRRTRRLGWAVLGGIGIGVTSLIRPLDGLTLAALLGLWTLPVHGRRLRFAPVVVLGAVTAAMAALVLPYNRALSGSPTVFPIMTYTQKIWPGWSNEIGFGANRGAGWYGLDPFPGHGVIDVAFNTFVNVVLTNTELLGWATGSLLLLAFTVLSRRLSRSDRLMVIAIVAIVAAMSLYWFSGGPDFGARYWFMIMIPCAALVARGIEILESATDRTAGPRVLPAAAALSLGALLVFVPWRAIDKYPGYRGMRPDVRRLAAEHDFGRSLVLVRGRPHPDYASAFVYNPVDLTSDATLYVHDRDPGLRARTLAAYPDRPVWILDGPTITGRGFEIAAGPIAPGSPERTRLAAQAGP